MTQKVLTSTQEVKVLTYAQEVKVLTSAQEVKVLTKNFCAAVIRFLAKSYEYSKYPLYCNFVN
jgi:hypothetical protein